ncbi:MAG TPA: hypothetical protein VK144_09335 [Bacillota bacterium]|nr:hypothetical protein [Bacillota bacterium]
MRNWFILFATTFTITTLVLTFTTYFITYMPEFNSRYIMLLAISSALISVFIIFMNRLPMHQLFLNISMDVIFIFLIVFITGFVIDLIPLTGRNLILVFVLVLIIYTIISLIYLFILKKEAEDMNEKISKWRKMYAESESNK